MAPFMSSASETAVRHRSRNGDSAVLSRTQLLFDDCGGVFRNNCRDVLTERSYLVITAYFVILTAVALYVHCWEPTSLKLSDEPLRPDTFIEERARGHLRSLTAFGPRPTGSYANEVLAVDYILRELQFISQRAKAVHSIEIDVQKPTGSFNLDFQDGFTSYYDKVKNVLVKIEPSAGTNDSVMVNCHYDSVPGSPGASDDAVSCAVMLEVLHLLSQSNTPFRHAIVFSFNGAEENILQASHGFITQHKWASKIRAFINLDSCGSGGRELLFQAGPENPWLNELYGRGAKYPFACVLAQEVFQSGVVPSDTDYRMFRDYGNIPGLDIAYIRNGYLYHTKFDSEEYISAGSVQRAGENLHGLIRELSMSSMVPNAGDRKNGNVVFFDFFGLFLVVYSEFMGSLLIHLCGAIVLGRTFYRMKRPHIVGCRNGSQYLKLLAKGIAIIVSSWVLSLLGLLIIALTLDVFGATMSWYTNQYLAFGLFLAPSIVIMMAVHSWAHFIVYKDMTNLWLAEQFNFESYQVCWCLINYILYMLNLKTSMVLLIIVLFPAVFRFLGDTFVYPRSKNNACDFLFINLLAWALPLELSIQAAVVAAQMLIPLVGRMGPVLKPDIFISVVFWIICILTYNALGFVEFHFGSSNGVLPLLETVGTRGENDRQRLLGTGLNDPRIIQFVRITFVHATRRIKRVMWGLGGIFVLAFLAAVLTPLGHPYSGDPLSPSPQRFMLSHVHRVLHQRNGDIRQEDSGFWAVPADYNAAQDMYDYVPEFRSNGHQVDADCDRELMCGMPFYYPALNRLRKSVYLLGPKPRFHQPVQLKLLSQKAISVDTRRLTFNATGPSHMAIYMSPAAGISLSRWSFANGLPYSSLTWDNRPTYFVYYSKAETSVPWQFWIELKVPASHPKTANVFHIAATAHYINGEDSVTPELQAFMEKFPVWTYSLAWASSYESWIF